jgi:hypothetical protein
MRVYDVSAARVPGSAKLVALACMLPQVGGSHRGLLPAQHVLPCDVTACMHAGGLAVLAPGIM